MKTAIALVGDFSPDSVAHRAIPPALELAGQAEGRPVTWTWVPTATIHDAARDLARYAGVWVVPASPYVSMAGALDAIRWARETRRPLFGSCGGFQHMLIELARSRAGLTVADTAETNPGGTELIITPLACSLVEQTSPLRFTPGSRLRAIYGRDTAVEGYHCRYGLNAAYRTQLEAAGLSFTAFDENGEVRGAELPESVHPFFIGTLFQPERAALRGEAPPLARALVRAAATFSP
jgi:CTP synthase (UTP-ammonia lyase)